MGRMQVCISLQTDNHASTSPLSFFTGQMPFLPPNQQRRSTEGTYDKNTFMYKNEPFNVCVRACVLNLCLCVCSLVPLQSSTGHKPLAADHALVRLDAAVCLGVDDQVSAARETLLTRRAHVRTWLAVGVLCTIRRVRTILACTHTHTPV